MKQFIKSTVQLVLPLGVRQRLRAMNRKMVFEYHLKSLRKAPQPYIDGSERSIKLMNRLIYGWGNPDWSADAHYLVECAQQVNKKLSNVLECGSGLSSLVLASVAANAKQTIFALEHNDNWATNVRDVAIDFGLSNLKIIHAPLMSYDDFDWYDITGNEFSDIGLVVCDGPPGNTRGGRVGLLPVIKDVLQASCIILLDDCQRPQELEVIKQWSSLCQFDYILIGHDKKFARITLGKA